MKKRSANAWPTWKILAVVIACAMAGTALLVAYSYIPAPPAAATRPASTAPATQPDPSNGVTSLGLGNLILLLSLLSWSLALTFIGWLGHRMYMRIPAWRRRQLFGRRR